MYISRMQRNLISEKGAALFIAMALIIALSAIAIIVVDRADTDIELSFNQLHQEQAFYMAEAGYEHAMYEIVKDYYWRAGIDSTPIGEGAYRVAIYDSLSRPALAETALVVSEALTRDASAEINAWLRRTDIYPFVWAAFGKDSSLLARRTCSDSYNSDSGSYAATVLAEGGDIGSNGAIDVDKDATIGGNVSTATDGGLLIHNLANVTGDTSSTKDSVFVDSLSDTEFAWAQSVNAAPPGLSGIYDYSPATDSLIVGAFNTVTLASGVYYFSGLDIGQSAHLQIAPGANVTIYLQGDITFGQDADVNSSGNPADLYFYSKGDSLNLNQNVKFYAGFYGPNSSIFIDQTAEVYGAILGGSIEMDQDACIHYDRALSKVVRPASGNYEAVAWSSK